MIDTEIGQVSSPTQRLVLFVSERQRMYHIRERGEPAPWTDDLVLRNYRFSNMLRENDTVTKWIANTWREPFAQHPDVWFAMVVARLVNEPEVLAEIGWPIAGSKWRSERFKEVIVSRHKRKLRAYNPAYMIAACKTKMPKVDLNIQVLDSLWSSRDMLRPKHGDTLRAYHVLLGQFWGLGSFLAAQVVADLKYAQPLRSASDWETFAASGPGSRRGLVRVHGLTVDNWRKWAEDDWWQKLMQLRQEIQPMFFFPELRMAHAQDNQNWLCEFDKYERARLGEGKPKQKYNGNGD